MSNGQTITQAEDETEEEFMNTVVETVLNMSLNYEACSPLGCPSVHNHPDHSRFSKNIPVCVDGSSETLQTLHQTWVIRPAEDYGPLPPINVEVSFFAPPGDLEEASRPGIKLPVTQVNPAGTHYIIMDSYGELQQRTNGSIDIFTAQIGIVGEDLLPEKVCLSRNSDRTITGTEHGGPLESRPCDSTDSSQAWMFVYLAPADVWRLQVPLDPFLCVTAQTEPVYRGLEKCGAPGSATTSRIPF